MTVEALFLKLVNMSISASWLVLAVVALRFAMKKAPKWMTCALWALVALRLVLPFSIESPASLIPDREPIPQSVLTDYTPIVTPGDTPVSSDTPVITPDTPMPGAQENTVTPAGITETAATVWAVGVTVLCVYAAVSYLLVRRRVAASLHLRDNVYLCDYIESPFILGIIRPRIYLPSSLDQSQWPHVLAHEQAHLSRRDHWWKPLGFGLLCVYWFNPVLWLAYVLLCRDIELACDERVIRDMDTRQKQDYTTALLECSMPRYLVAACPLAFGEVGVKERVKTVLNYKKPAFWIILIALILCIAAAVCFLTDPVGNNAIVPGVYNIDITLYQEDLRYDGVPQYVIAPGQYILSDNTLYLDSGDAIVAHGQMTPYDLTNRELNGYLQVDSWWKTFFHNIPTISEALWLRMENGRFFVWFQTTTGETFLGTGVEDLSERYEDYSDDTYISQLCLLTLDNNAEESELSWFDATVLDAQSTFLRAKPVSGTWESQYGELEVSLWWHDSYTDENGQTVFADGVLPGEFAVGDRVRIVYDGNIAETYPARVNKTYSVTKLDAPEAEYVTYGSIEEAILDGCVAMVNGDVVAGQKSWERFLEQIRNGQSAAIRLVKYDTLTNPEIYEPGNFEEVFRDYPQMAVHDLRYDGTRYTLRTCSGGIVSESVWDYLVSYSQVDWDSQRYNSYTVLCNMPDLTWEDYRNSTGISFTSIRTYPIYYDPAYEDTPTLAELEAAKSALEPYMIEYKINSLDANELTMRLDIGVSQWVDGLEDLVEQFMDWEFVTVTYQEEGSFVLTDRNDLYTRFTDYFGLPTINGLELYAFDDGYVLMAGTNRIKTEDEINALPRATAEEMREILESYHVHIEKTNIIIDNRTNRTEREIRKELGILATADVALYVTNATATEGLAKWYITVHPGCEVWTGYDYTLEVYTEDGWEHYGYPTEELAWPAALRFHYENTGAEPISFTEVYDVQWSATTGGSLPPGRYRYLSGLTVYCDGEYSSVSCTGYFEIPEDSPENPGVHLEILNPTDTGATLAVTYNGGLMGELSTQGQYYLMVYVDNNGAGGVTKYGLVPSQVDWDDVLYPLNIGETVYIDVRWDHTAEAPLPTGIYNVELLVNQSITYGTGTYQDTLYVTGTFAIID